MELGSASAVSLQEKRFLRGTSVDALLEASHIANDKVLRPQKRHNKVLTH
jgi:hypothetical protein